MGKEDESQCLICGQPLPSPSSLCASCADPKLIILTCRCGQRFEMEPGSVGVVGFARDLGMTLSAGMAVALENCSKCAPRSKTVSLSLYRIVPTHN